MNMLEKRIDVMQSPNRMILILERVADVLHPKVWIFYKGLQGVDSTEFSGDIFETKNS